MSASEHVLMREIRAAIAPFGPTWRNNVGNFYTLGKAACCAHCGGNLLGGRAVRGAAVTACGLGTGSADLVGVHAVTVTSEMLGTTFGRFVAIEVKTSKGRVRPEQAQWHQVVSRHGALVGVARSVDEALALIGGEK